MIKVLLIFLIYCLSLSFFSCSSSTTDNSTTDNSTTDNELTINNNTILSGSRIGSGEESNSDLSKSVQISVRDSGLFTYKTPYVGRSSDSSESIYWTIPIRNWSKEPLCFIKMTSIKFYDSSNNIIDFEDRSYVDGSIGVVDGSTYTGTCLNNQEEGYVGGIQIGDFYTKVSKIVVSKIEYSPRKISEPSVNLKPLYYTTSGTYKTPIVRVKNDSDIDVDIRNIKLYILDSNNNPILWTYLYVGSISSNSAKSFLDNNLWYPGSRYKIHVFISFQL